jgi:hypothetical protein
MRRARGGAAAGLDGVGADLLKGAWKLVDFENWAWAGQPADVAYALRYTSRRLDVAQGDLVLEATYDRGNTDFRINKPRFIELFGQYHRGDLVIDDGSEALVLEEPARDYLPSSRPGARLPHGWLADGRSTLDLIAPDIPTLLLAAGSEAPILDPSITVKVVEVPVEIWSEAFAIDAATCLLVRPDQHIAFRGPAAGVPDALRAMFATNADR